MLGAGPLQHTGSGAEELKPDAAPATVTHAMATPGAGAAVLAAASEADRTAVAELHQGTPWEAAVARADYKTRRALDFHAEAVKASEHESDGKTHKTDGFEQPEGLSAHQLAGETASALCMHAQMIICA